MFDRRKYKKFARMQLSKRWTVPVLATLVCLLAMLILSVPEYIEELKSGDFLFYSDSASSVTAFESSKTAVPEALFTFLEICIMGTLAFGQAHLFIKMSRGPEKVYFSDFLNGISQFVRASLAALWMYLWVFLWSLLFLIPGIVKYISYSQTLYLLAEYPNLSVTQAMNISKIITIGKKGDLFTMYLSFLGWAILAMIPAGLGFLWLIPYKKMSFVNAYHGLLKDAVQAGVIRVEDLTGKPSSEE